MSDGNINFDQLDGGGLRKELERVLAANKELRDKVTGFEGVQRTREAESFLSDRGLNPKLAKFVPAEAVGDPRAMDNWVKENADLFPATSSQSEAPVQQETAPDEPLGEPSISAGSREAWSKIERVAANGTVQSVDVAALESQIAQAKNPAELMALMRQYQIS